MTTATTEQPILAAAKASIQALTPASPASAASTVIVYPDDYTGQNPSLPFVAVRLGYGPITNEPRGMSTAIFRQGTLVIEVYTASGALPVPSVAHAASELKKRQWWKVIAEWLYDDRSLTGTVIDIGNSATVFTDERVYLQWNQDEYDGLYVTVPFTYEVC